MTKMKYCTQSDQKLGGVYVTLLYFCFSFHRLLGVSHLVSISAVDLSRILFSFFLFLFYQETDVDGEFKNNL